ncbi:hypothetical protein GCM10023174_07250 [Chelativorans composti]
MAPDGYGQPPMELPMFILALALTMTVVMIAVTISRLNAEAEHKRISTQWDDTPAEGSPAPAHCPPGG